MDYDIIRNALVDEVKNYITFKNPNNFDEYHAKCLPKTNFNFTFCSKNSVIFSSQKDNNNFKSKRKNTNPIKINKNRISSFDCIDLTNEKNSTKIIQLEQKIEKNKEENHLENLYFKKEIKSCDVFNKDRKINEDKDLKNINTENEYPKNFKKFIKKQKNSNRDLDEYFDIEEDEEFYLNRYFNSRIKANETQFIKEYEFEEETKDNTNNNEIYYKKKKHVARKENQNNKKTVNNICEQRDKNQHNEKNKIKRKKSFFSENDSENKENINNKCIICYWEYPKIMSSDEKNAHVNLCLEGKGEIHKSNYLSTMKLLEITIERDKTIQNNYYSHNSKKMCPFCQREIKKSTEETHLLDCYTKMENDIIFLNRKKKKIKE